MTKFIAVISGKGGVGKTTASINLGVALSNAGKDVIVVDGNVQAPDVAMHLGSNNLQHTLQDALKEDKRIGEALYLHPSGIRVVPGSVALEEVNTDLLKKVIRDLDNNADIVIIDSPAGLSKESKSIIDAADEVLVVTTPDRESVLHSLRSLKYAEEAGITVIGAVVNMPDGQRSINNIQKTLDLPVISTIPKDNAVVASRNMCEPVACSHPRSKATRSFKNLASYLVDEE